MSDDTIILKPWYAVNDDPMRYEPFNARESGADGKAHIKAYHRMQELWREANTSKEDKRRTVQREQTSWLIVITKAIRGTLHNGKPYTDNDSRKWFEKKLAAGLTDVFFVNGDWAKGPLQTDDIVGIICWYNNGEKRYTTIDIDEEDKPYLTEKGLLDTGYQKPEISDNRLQLERVLRHLAIIADANTPTRGWGNYFRRAASEAKDGDLLEAVSLSQTGGGIGSWYDTPAIDLEETKLLNHQLYIERQHAVIYAVNYG